MVQKELKIDKQTTLLYTVHVPFTTLPRRTMRTNAPTRKLRDPKTWAHGRIAIKQDFVDVRFVPIDNGRKRIAVGYDGKIYVRETRREIWHSITRGIYTLVRRDHHAKEWYRTEELPKLAHIVQHLHELDSEFVGLLSSTPADEKTAIQARLARVLSGLGPVVDPAKQHAKHQLVFVLPLVDSRGRVNQGVFRCRTNRALRYIEVRLEEIAGIRPWMLRYEGIVLELAKLMEDRSEEIYRLLRTLYRQLGSLDGTVNVRAAHETIGKISRLTGDLVCTPYINMGTYLQQEAAQISIHLHHGRIDDARKLVVTMGNSVKMKRIRQEMEVALVPLFAEYPGARAAHEDTQAWADQIRTWINDQVSGPIDEIDETGFTRPVKDTVLRSLGAVLAELREVTSLSHQKVLSLKEQVKDAAAQL